MRHRVPPTARTDTRPATFTGSDGGFSGLRFDLTGLETGVGDDTGPTPYDLLHAGLGTCTSRTLPMYADRKDWPLSRVEVHLSHDRIHAEDCADCDAASGIIETIELRGPLTEEQRSGLLAIADRCPVHRTLTGGDIHVRTRLLDATAVAGAAPAVP